MRNKAGKLLIISSGLWLSLFQTNMAFAGENPPLLDKNYISIGAGASRNSLSGPTDSEIGFQFFGAYDLNRVNLMEGVKSSVEVGFMDYGFAGSSSGLWGTYVIDGAIKGKLGWLARLGLDLGDDSGVMAGAGIGLSLSDKLDFRCEYVIRDDVDSIQLNVLLHL